MKIIDEGDDSERSYVQHNEHFEHVALNVKRLTQNISRTFFQGIFMIFGVAMCARVQLPDISARLLGKDVHGVAVSTARRVTCPQPRTNGQRVRGAPRAAQSRGQTSLPPRATTLV